MNHKPQPPLSPKKTTGEVSAWARFSFIVKNPSALAANLKGKKRGIMRKAALFVMEGALLATLIIGGANLLDEVGNKANETRFSNSEYSQKLKDWQQKTHGQHHGVKVAVLDIDRLILAGLNPDDVREEVRLQAKNSLGVSSYWIGSLFNLYDKSADYAVKNTPTAWTQAMIAPSPYWRTSSAANPDIYAHLYARITIVVPPHNLQTPEDYLRLMGNVFDPSMSFRDLPKRAELMDFVMGDETGHGFDFNWGRGDFDRLKEESFGDIMGVLEVISNYGDKSKLPRMVRDLRIIGAMQGGIEHYTAPALDVAIPIAEKLYRSGKLQNMSLMQRAKLAQKIIAKVWVDEAKLDNMKALAKLMPEGLFANQNIDGLDGVKFAKTPDAAKILQEYKAASGRLFEDANIKKIGDNYEKQLDELFKKRGISPQHRGLIISYAEQNLGFLKLAEKSNMGKGKLINQKRQEILNEFIERCKKAGIDKNLKPVLKPQKHPIMRFKTNNPPRI